MHWQPHPAWPRAGLAQPLRMGVGGCGWASQGASPSRPWSHRPAGSGRGWGWGASLRQGWAREGGSLLGPGARQACVGLSLGLGLDGFGDRGGAWAGAAGPWSCLPAGAWCPLHRHRMGSSAMHAACPCGAGDRLGRGLQGGLLACPVHAECGSVMSAADGVHDQQPQPVLACHWWGLEGCSSCRGAPWSLGDAVAPSKGSAGT